MDRMAKTFVRFLCRTSVALVATLVLLGGPVVAQVDLEQNALSAAVEHKLGHSVAGSTECLAEPRHDPCCSSACAASLLPEGPASFHAFTGFHDEPGSPHPLSGLDSEGLRRPPRASAAWNAISSQVKLSDGCSPIPPPTAITRT